MNVQRGEKSSLAHCYTLNGMDAARQVTSEAQIELISTNNKLEKFPFYKHNKGIHSCERNHWGLKPFWSFF